MFVSSSRTHFATSPISLKKPSTYASFDNNPIGFFWKQRMSLDRDNDTLGRDNGTYQWDVTMGLVNGMAESICRK